MVLWRDSQHIRMVNILIDTNKSHWVLQFNLKNIYHFPSYTCIPILIALVSQIMKTLWQKNKMAHDKQYLLLWQYFQLNWNIKHLLKNFRFCQDVFNSLLQITCMLGRVNIKSHITKMSSIYIILCRPPYVLPIAKPRELDSCGDTVFPKTPDLYWYAEGFSFICAVCDWWTWLYAWLTALVPVKWSYVKTGLPTSCLQTT